MAIVTLAIVGLFRFLVGFLCGQDFAECEQAESNAVEANRMRAGIRGVEKRVCIRGPERCLCNVCAPTAYLD